LQCQDQPDNQNEGVPELIEMRNGFVGVAQGSWEGIRPGPGFRQKTTTKDGTATGICASVRIWAAVTSA